ncbi:hypothetical protein pb186bvf_004493 [Paramecium bursaria]
MIVSTSGVYIKIKQIQIIIKIYLTASSCQNIIQI